MKVLVTGANGHLGYNLAHALVRQGHAVRASIRSLADAERLERVRATGAVEVVEAALDRPDQLRAAMEGIDVLFHAAAVYAYHPQRGEDDLLRAAIQGAENALCAAADAGVRKVVLTSSTVTLPFTKPGAPPSTEADWNEDLRVPYFRAKTLGEKRAWAVAAELGLDMVAVLPGAICGPGFVRNTPSIDTLHGIMLGTMRFGAPDTNFPYVDVRDVVAAHLLVVERDASGRFIACNDVLPSFREIAAEMHRIDPRIPEARRLLPNAIAPVLPLFDRLNHYWLGAPRVLTPELVATLEGRIWNCSNARLRNELGWRQTVSLQQSLADTLVLLRARDSHGASAPQPV